MEKISYWEMPIQKNRSHESLIERVCEGFKMTKNELLAKTRKQEIIEPRRIISYILYAVYKSKNYREIGVILGGQSHCNVLAAVNKAQDFIDTERDYNDLIYSFV